MASRKTKDPIGLQLSVADALRALDRLRQVSSSTSPESYGTGGLSYEGKVSVPGLDQLSNKAVAIDQSVGTGVSTQPPSELMKAIETGDKNTASTLRGEIKSKVWTTAATISLTVSLAVSAIIIAVVLYLHSDLKTEQKALEDRIMSVVNPVKDQLGRIMESIGKFPNPGNSAK